LTIVFALYYTPAFSCLLFFCFQPKVASFACKGTAMARVKSTAQLRKDAPIGTNGGCNNADSAERTESVHVSDVGTQSHEGESDGGSHTRGCYFGPSTVTVSRIRDMMDQGYFTEGGARAPGEETIPELERNEAIVFEEIFTTRLRMSSNPILSDILLKFQVQLH
jgi:hypothetical protein